MREARRRAQGVSGRGRPKARARRGLEVAGVWDIECSRWDRFLCGELLGVDGEVFRSWDEDEFFDALIRRRGVWYAHVGGRYDALWLLDTACRRRIPWSARLRGSGILSARIGDLEVRDSHALVPMSLAKGAPMGTGAKVGLSLPCECGRDCGGYCVLDRRLTAREKREVETYLHNDCVALRAMLDALGTVCEREGILLGLTVGGTAWATARDWLDLPRSTLDLGTYKHIRGAYYGGRVEVFQALAAKGHRYDIHSSYPAALTRVYLPIGLGRMRDRRGASADFAAGREGVYHAVVHVPECDVPPLPVRTPERLLYPHGSFQGTWTGLELRHAVECGATVERVRTGYTYADSAVLLEPYASRVWRLRANAMECETPTGDAWAAWYKFLANTMTGKLAQSPVHEALKFAPCADDGGPPELPHDVTVARHTRSGAFITTPSMRVDACAHPQWAAYLTAEARIELHRQLLTAAQPLYCDTDSVYARGKLTRGLGPELGQWGYEGPLTKWHALAPKVYRYHDGKRFVVRGKGMSGLTSDGFKALARGEAWIADRGVNGLRTALAKGEGLFVRKHLTRRLKPVAGWIGGRELDADGIGTRATTVARYEARDGRSR